MKMKCEYCGNTYEDTQEKCPYCGAPNINRHANEIRPRTIEELKQWYKTHNLPPEHVTRFFIGKDIKEPKAFGIYKDTDNSFVVYKNKADGTRAIRYHGTDEEYAVNELYQKLKEEALRQKMHQIHEEPQEAQKIQKTHKLSESLSDWLLPTIFIVAWVTFGIIFVFSGASELESDNNDYQYVDTVSYQNDDFEHLYDGSKDSLRANYIVSNVINNIDADENDYQEYYWDTSTNISDSDNSDFSYHAYSDYNDDNWDSDWDSDFSWDTGSSWDSSGTNWDSDW